MSRTKRGLTIASTLLLVAVLISACEQPYSTPPVATLTPIDSNSLFTTQLPSEPGNMSDVENATTQTAVALTQTPSSVDITPASVVTATPTPIIELNPTATATQAVVNNAPTSTSVPSSSGTEWILKDGEFPFCIARRYNVDPQDLIAVSGLTSPDIYYEGQRLIIPQNSTWPASAGPRSLRNHPDTYTVTGTSDTTVYGVACKYGDVDPAAIAQANGISVGTTLTVGQQLSVP